MSTAFDLFPGQNVLHINTCWGTGSCVLLVLSSNMINQFPHEVTLIVISYINTRCGGYSTFTSPVVSIWIHLIKIHIYNVSGIAFFDWSCASFFIHETHNICYITYLLWQSAGMYYNCFLHTPLKTKEKRKAQQCVWCDKGVAWRRDEQQDKRQNKTLMPLLFFQRKHFIFFFWLILLLLRNILPVPMSSLANSQHHTGNGHI